LQGHIAQAKPCRESGLWLAWLWSRGPNLRTSSKDDPRKDDKRKKENENPNHAISDITGGAARPAFIETATRSGVVAQAAFSLRE